MTKRFISGQRAAGKQKRMDYQTYNAAITRPVKTTIEISAAAAAETPARNYGVHEKLIRDKQVWLRNGILHKYQAIFKGSR